MGWFDEQVAYRKKLDDENFADAFMNVASSIIGKRLNVRIEEKQVIESALHEVLKYYQYDVKTFELPDDIEALEDQINYCMRPYGIMHREVRLDEDWYKCSFGAMLGSLKDGTPIALIPRKIHGYKYYDYNRDEYVNVSKSTFKEINRDVICFYKPLPSKKLTISDLIRFMFSILTTSDIILYLFTALLATLLGMISPVITKLLFSNVVESESMRLLVAISIFMVCNSISTLLFSTFQGLISERIGTKQNVVVQAAVMSRIISLPPNFFRDYSSGELSSRSSYVQQLCSIIFNNIATSSITSLFSLIYIGQIFSFAPALVVPSIIVTILTLIVSLMTTFVQIKVSKESMMISTKESGMSYAMITGIQKIKLAGAEKRMFSRWAKLYSQGQMLVNHPPKIVKYGSVITTAIALFSEIVLYYIAIQSHVSVADYYAFNASYGMVSGAFTSFASIAITLADIKPILEMAKPILEAEPEASDSKEIVTSLSGSIELSNISFKYDDDGPLIIDNLSLKVKAGEYLAIVGSTGCGKSTLLRLLLGFEKPSKGIVYYDQKDTNRIDLQSLRRKIGVVMQDGKLFTGDIYSNIVISAPQLTLDDAWEAARIASLDEDIEQMPMGMFTLISEGQGGISGGQKQRLMIARAVASKPRILMFDEATSALDNITQKNVSDAIDKLKCTRIVIAHRLSTIKHCDRIVVLDHGKIVEDGNYEELIAKDGFFAKLVARQRLDYEDE
ncbi:MAG: NHLP bacteriocin export ABC transporter permease/ATPase subunit [Erysipelotrichaceae bacterium]|nr:NHLP bacteriocin export ABC transporter permease/ATPase subunit [Erysipelotrichaceae bacterium]